jgi:UDP-3-O-[3-hydroxymyristoyl] glucosamine N-acyltransferase
MSDLTNSLINATYKKLIQVSSSGNEGISGTLTNVQTGDGTNTALKLATSAAQVDGTLFVGQTFGVSGDASVAGGLAVANKVCASAYYGDGSNLTGLVFTGDVSVSSLVVGGNVTIGGTLNVAGNTTITGNVMVSGGEVVIKNTGTQSNIKLYCESSNAHYAALQAPPHSSFSGNITITLPTSAATLVGTSTTDTLTNKTFGDKVDFNSDVCISGDSVLVGSATIGGTLSVGGAVNMLSTATVSGTAGFLGAVRVSGNTSVGGTLDVGGNVSIGGNVTVKGDVHVSSKVCASAFYGDGTNITGIPITGNISVSNAIVGGTLSVSGATHLKSTVSIAGAVNLASTLTVASNASVGGTLSVGGAVNLLGTATVSGAAGFLTTARVSGNTSIGGTLDVAGNVSFMEMVLI